MREGGDHDFSDSHGRRWRSSRSDRQWRCRSELREDDGVVTKKQPDKPQESLVHPDDRAWISEEIAAEVLKRAADGSKPIPWSQVEAELDALDREGI
jgi:hypothetical protein